jgi:hypothetical protein
MPRPPRFPDESRSGGSRDSNNHGGAVRAALIACTLTAGAVGALVLVAGRPAPAPALSAATHSCPSAEMAVVGPAVLAYITEQREPTPQRFLYAVGTDSALPDPGVVALQDKGPTYMYPPNPAQQAVVRAKLEKVGPWASMLVVYHGTRLADPTHAVVRLGGRYVGGKSDGLEAPGRSVSFTCESGEWRLTRTAEERST